MEKIARSFRVCLTGAESTGKTELAKALARHFSAVLVPEYSREYSLARQNALSYSDVGPIAHGQMEREDAAVGSHLIILDTDTGANAIAELPDVLMGFKNGRQVFERKRPKLFPPH